MNDDDPALDSGALLAQLRLQHRALDEQIRLLLSEPGGNQLEIARLRRRKLALKDRIQLVLDTSTPDIIA